MLGLVSCFCWNGVVLSTEEVLSNCGKGGGPTVCEVWFLAFAAME